MFSFRELMAHRLRKAAFALALSAVLAGAAGMAAAQTQTASPYPGIGRAATAPEVRAWDIDVRPDFKGLPAGSGSVAKGMEVWESKCSSCHGIFGESNTVFNPVVGGTTADDIKTGRVARLTDRNYPSRTTLMKLSSLSTLWDYINRAMPWNAPKTLSTDEVYAVTAYMLNLGGVLPDDFVLSNQTMAQAQARLPNRQGMSTDHGLWPGKGLGNGGKPDVKSVACMNNCDSALELGSSLPDFARNAHGNLAEQNRAVGAQHGIDTTQAPGAAPTTAATAPAAGATAATAAASPGAVALALLKKHGCTVCHGMDNKILGPAFTEVSKKYAGKGDAAAYLADKIKGGAQGVWGPIPMPAQALPEVDAKSIAAWLAAGAKK